MADEAAREPASAPAPASVPPAHAGFEPVLRIDWIAAEAFHDGRPGRLGITFLPGKRGPSYRYPGHVYRRDLVEDLTTLHAAGVRLLIVLVEDYELERWSDPTIVERGRAIGLAVYRHPIPDGSPPADRAAMDEILEQVDTGRAVSDVAVVCMGGVGRSGTVAACALVRAGMSAADAIALVRAVRHPSAVETRRQEAFVADYARG